MAIIKKNITNSVVNKQELVSIQIDDKAEIIIADVKIFKESIVDLKTVISNSVIAKKQFKYSDLATVEAFITELESKL